ncbi:hypothetical protein G6F57_005531 [Rhizopus arrhizus]|uniref:Xylanolytic transcriptional activator regulatory domain-containing protein n=1 Tax=Rhizopus oryzae TaxID=64495 RepID=A0A9P7BSD6_RHIOR|nr:hypothetical protein G6F23_001936 [Rhizopus arrhizus]KAG1420687.1 hypothetical protein G6F58_004073 [Rhizopus delemar]KAG0762846.1 hypothetical protein G6F24_006483 [Rhizopus arrhizus]KAG0789392.1 hypothetical protein G6F21_006545 [Rhizopus arrhizus]KAG0799307.1 hypothetical protein G6F22_003360 [Rhizopus arrhizus]
MHAARGIDCSFYKDGSLEADMDGTMNQKFNEKMIKEPIKHNSLPSEQAIFFSEQIDENHAKLKRKGPMLESRVSNMLACLGDVLKKTPSTDGTKLSEKLWPPAGSFGNFIVWTAEPPLPSRYSGSIEMPSAEIQMALIDSFFQTRHQVLQCMIPSYFYEQLKVKGLFITPLLLNAIYALSARFANIPNCPKPDIFFHRAKRLIEDFMDVPRLSTTIAAYLLSLYEPPADIYRPGSHHCRQWLFSGMAFRMCLELGLYDENNVDPNLSLVEKELRRRVFWSCYCLDKLQSTGWERPWMLRHTFVRVHLPSPLPEENKQEQFNIKVFVQHIKFTIIIEQDLELKNKNRSSLSRYSEENTTQQDICSLFTDHFNKCIDFFYSIPTDMQWIPRTATTIKDILQLSKPTPIVAHLHMFFHILLIDLLTKIPATDVNRPQLRIAATAITQISYYLCQEPSYILKLDYIAHALINAIKIHMLYLEDDDISVAEQAWLLFYRSIYCMQQLVKYVVIPNCHKFLQQVYHVYGMDLSDFDPNEPSTKRQKSSSIYNNNDSRQKSFTNYNTEQRIPLFQYHQPSQFIQNDLWSLPKPILPTMNPEVTVPSQLNRIQDGVYGRWPDDDNNDTERQSIDNNKLNTYLQNGYNGIINNYP